MPNPALVRSGDRAPIRRHDLVWLDPEKWEANQLSYLDSNLYPAVRSWIAREYPVVARRRDEHGPKTGIAVGIPLSLQNGVQRVALNVAMSAVRMVQRPPTLNSILRLAPVSWKLPLKRFATAIYQHDVIVRVYGSLMWQSLTHETYLHAKSDIDFLLELNGATQLSSILQLLQSWEQEHGIQADGEFVLQDGRAISWRELAGSHAQVLVKSLVSVELLPRITVLRLLECSHP